MRGAGVYPREQIATFYFYIVIHIVVLISLEVQTLIFWINVRLLKGTFNLDFSFFFSLSGKLSFLAYVPLFSSHAVNPNSKQKRRGTEETFLIWNEC